MNRLNVLFIQPLFCDPNLPNFKDRFELLSEKLSGHIISMSEGRHDGLRFGSFTYHRLPYIKNKLARYIVHFVMIMVLGVRLNRQSKFDYVHSYDPIFFGISAVFIKWLTKAKLIVEINGHFNDPALLPKNRTVRQFKILLFSLLIKVCIKKADVIKFLNRTQMFPWQRHIAGKKTFIFHDFVPTHLFDPKKSMDEKYVLFAGFPFYTKGVDILINAFLSIADMFPDIKLKIVGHCPGGDNERDVYKKMAKGSSQIDILKPVFYNEAANLFQKCTLFVLPSRSEAMGRVLIEAMSCAKAVIGSDVGGIPSVIRDEENGLLFKNCDAGDLASKMKRLLSSPEIRKEMGLRGHEMVQQKYSSTKYVHRFLEMLES